MSRRKILVADLLCGAGGSSTGCERALRDLGLEMELVCVNHWPTAIETHRLNHPAARHYVQDIATVRPHLIVPEGYLDLLMASPTCTHHSVARGGKPTSDQQRSDPWHIITWLTELRVKRVIIENVWEFIGWGPVDPKTGRPIPARKGEYFNAWIDTLRRLGFGPRWQKLNAADYGDATTRKRFILMARSDGKRVFHPVATHARKPDEGLALFPTLEPWKPARKIIDWSIRGRSIFNRDKDLAEKTLLRIYAGAERHGWPPQFLKILRDHMAARGLALPPSAVGAGGHGGVAEAVLFANRTNNAPRSPDEPAPVFTTAPGGGVVVVEPLVVNMKGKSTASSVEQPLPTQTAQAGHLCSAEPVVLGVNGSGAARSVDEPMMTITTGGAGSDHRVGCARPMLVEPFVATVAHSGSDVARCKSLDEPLDTIHAGGGSVGIVQPFVLSQASGGAPRLVEEPLPTIVAGTAGSGTALISPYYGSGSGETCTTVEEPLPTATAKARFGMVVPVTNSNGGALARSTEEPLATMTTAKGGEFAVVMPVTHHDGSDRVRGVDEPLPTVTGANRGELAFITAQHGEREGQAPRVHSVEDPAPTIAATGHVDLVQGIEVDGARYDILFRMLEPHELAAAMGFTSEDQAYEFAGTKTDQVKQIGNAVSVAVMKACVGAIMADAAPKRRATPAAVKQGEAA